MAEPGRAATPLSRHATRRKGYRRRGQAAHLDVMVRAAREAGALLLRYYGRLTERQIASKSRNDFVTVVDRKSQALILRMLRAAFPSYGVKAEEGGLYLQKDRMWVIDPLDGTSNYIHRFPLFCVSLALVEKGLPEFGVVFDPVHNDCFTAARGSGAFLNGRRIRVSPLRRFAQAFIATGFPYRMRDHFEPYHRSLRSVFYRTAGIRRGGSAALDLCYAACGRVDGFWEFGLSEWDIAAGTLIVEEAGGIVSDFRGDPGYSKSGNVVAGNPAVHAGLVAILKGIRGFGAASGRRPRGQ